MKKIKQPRNSYTWGECESKGKLDLIDGQAVLLSELKK